MRVRRSVVNAVLVLAAGSLATGAAAQAQSQAPKPFPDEWFFDGTQRPAPLRALEGKPAPALAIQAWIGTETSIKANRGKVVVVDFWATWCGPCMASIPHNVELVSKHASEGLVFVGVHDSNSGWDGAAQVVREKGINYPVGEDKSGGASVKDFAVQFWPTYVAIDKAGVIRAAGLMPDRVEDVVKALLAEKAPDGPEPVEAFAADFYNGGSNRPKSLRQAEGKPSPSLKGQAWIGAEPEQGALKGNVTVLTFVSPSLGMSMAELDKVAPVEKEFSPQGVAFVAVCDGRAGAAGWEKMEKYVKARSVKMPVMHDGVETPSSSPSDKPASISATASAFGVEHFPAIVVVDRSGTVRAAGIKSAKLKAVIEKLLGEQAEEHPSKPDESGK